MGMVEKEFMTPDEAAELFSVSKKTFLRWAREKGIERIKPSSKVVLFGKEAIEEFAKARTVKVESERAKRAETRRLSCPRKRKGGKPSSGELWRDLRKEVLSWQ